MTRPQTADAVQAAEAAESRIRGIFRNWDASGHGRISAEDMRAVLLKLGVPEESVQRIFEAADSNRDGWIEYDEFLAWICGSSQQVRDVRNRLENPRVFAAVGAEDPATPRRDVAGGITDEELAEIRAMTKPNPVVARTLEALYLILNAGSTPAAPRRPPQQHQVARLLRDPELGERLRRFKLETLRAAPELTAYLVQNYFGPGGANPPERLVNGQETLTCRRVRRASRTAALLFQWTCKELIDVGALLPAPEEVEQPEVAEAPQPEPAPPKADPEVLARQLRNQTQPDLSGDLARLPLRKDMVEPQQVLLQLLAGSASEATELAQKLGSNGPCDRCDGTHHALDCPHFGPHKGHKAWTPRSRGREDHEDAWANLDGADGEQTARPETAVTGTQIRQPGDGTCLYHSMAFGLRRARLAEEGFVGPALRARIADHLEEHADDRVSGSAYRDYIWWDHGLTVEAYCHKMRKDGVWGGAIEIAACTQMYGVNVHIYVPEQDDRAHAPNKQKVERFRRIAAFGEDQDKPTVTITYMLRCHYDALQILATS